MPEWRTQPQVDADEALAKAVADVVSAYGEEEDPLEGRVVGEYVVVCELPGLSDELANTSRYDYLLSNGSMPKHHLLGLLAWASERAKSLGSGNDTDEE